MFNSSTDTVPGRHSRTSTAESDLQHAIEAVRAGDKVTAYRILQSQTAQNPADPNLWVWLGGTSPTFDGAESAFRKAREIDPNNREAELGLRWVALRRDLGGDMVAAGDVPYVTGTLRSTGPLKAPVEAEQSKGIKLFGMEMSTATLILMLVVLIAFAATMWYLLTRS